MNAPIAYLTRRAVFSASHRLNSLALSAEENTRVFGKCNGANGHGHNYVLEVTIRAPIDPVTGMTMSLTTLKQIIESEIISRFDHKNLNLDTSEFRERNPTAENRVVVFWGLLAARLPQGTLHELKLHETENNVAVYRGE